MSDEHTPGPWEIDGTGCVLRTKTGINERGGMTGGVGIAQFFGEHTPSEGDGRLIAAAPDLLEALKSVVYAFGMNNAEPQELACALGAQMERASAAIKKAEGGS